MEQMSVFVGFCLFWFLFLSSVCFLVGFVCFVLFYLKVSEFSIEEAVRIAQTFLHFSLCITKILHCWQHFHAYSNILLLKIKNNCQKCWLFS